MTLYRNITAFSQNGEYLAYSSPDGCLKIWETSTNILKQEYTPSSHLSATCSSLSWGPYKQTSQLAKSPKKLRGNDASLGNLQLISMGTMTGDILLYSFASADLFSCLTNGHTSAVNDLCWCKSTNSLFSCSDDQYIIQWDIYSGKTKTKWKADKSAIHSICVIDENSLLSATTSIQWWDIKQKTIIKNFNGHATEIFRLLPLCIDNDSINHYCLSSAIGDRVINAWHLDENGSKRAVASFVSSGEPVNINLNVKNNEPFRMSVVTKEGLFHLFEHTLNGKTKKPLLPKFSIQVASNSKDSHSKHQSLPILAGNMSDGLASCILAYGNFLKPSFENINISEFDKDVFLIRDLSSSFFTASSTDEAVSRVKHTEKTNSVKSLTPGYMTEVALLETASKKRKKKSEDVKELPMEVQLKALELTTTPESRTEQEPVIKADSKVHVLLQGLQSKDNNMLNSVLQCGDETIIYNTLERLPLNSIPLVLQEIYIRISKRERSTNPCLKWLSSLVDIHRSYLMSNEDIDKYFEPFSQLFEARAVQNFPTMSRLRGCFNIALSKAVSASSKSTDITSTPLTDDDVQEEDTESSNSESDMED
ncbi:hypothetical protein JTE90_017559 [Oedothorax gibbosus]|uniref:Small-subunit processome Utp12 domain-containing protein n=1 Tax=Oedothorax gibbosus TaxID=931172 RepID=A0AAV6UMM7_9ARAC|nr:hypothetical protein JTE90_017559 [Oedothorax gibbosus]